MIKNCVFQSLGEILRSWRHILITVFPPSIPSQVTMATKDAARLACADANPIIDGRKANVNLAIIGAKPRNNATQNGKLATQTFIMAAILDFPFSLHLPTPHPKTLPSWSYDSYARGPNFIKPVCTKTC